MNILAIDPGTIQSAIVAMDGAVPYYAATIKNDEMLSYIRDREPCLDHIVIEMVACYGMPVGVEIFETVVWIGRFIEAAGGDAHRLTRVDVKKHLCHKVVGVNDAVIRQRLIDKFGPGKEKAIGTRKRPGPLFGIKGDEWAALALGVTFSEQRGA